MLQSTYSFPRGSVFVSTDGFYPKAVGPAVRGVSGAGSRAGVCGADSCCWEVLPVRGSPRGVPQEVHGVLLETLPSCEGTVSLICVLRALARLCFVKLSVRSQTKADAWGLQCPASSRESIAHCFGKKAVGMEPWRAVALSSHRASSPGLPSHQANCTNAQADLKLL